jgi:hypothetical protein
MSLEGIDVKPRFMVCCCLTLVVTWAGLASAQLAVWDKGGKTSLWSEAANWNPDKVPTVSDAVQIDMADANCVIDDSATAVALVLDVSNLTKTLRCGLEVKGGSLTIGGNLRIANTSDCNAIFTMTGGTVNTSNKGRLWVGMNNRAYGVFVLRGGEITVSDKVEVGKNAGSTGIMYIQGGVLNVAGYGSDDFELATYGTGTIYMTGGTINVTDQIKLAAGNASTTSGVGRVYLDGGTFNAASLKDPATIYGTPLVDITAGRLVLTGDATAMVNQYLSKGWLIGYGGLGKVQVSFDAATNKTTVTGSRMAAEYAWKPSPSNTAVVERTATGPVLSWSPGEYVATHDVYLGTDKDAVAKADRTTAGVYKGSQTKTSFDPGVLDLGRTYYWRVDEVNDNAVGHPGSPWKGEVWAFTVAEYLAVDDMESYGTADTPGSPSPVGSRIWYTWKDGEGWTNPSKVAGNGSGSVVDPNRTLIHGGTQSLKIFYDNSGTNLFGNPKAYYSEVAASTSDLAIGQDWTQAGVKSLSLWFYGPATNDANATERLYVKLNQSRIAYSGPLIYMQDAKWHEWNIDLSRMGVNLTAVTSVSVGLGDPAGTQPGGSGILYVDDIRLYIPRCLPTFATPAGDLDGDCDVDFADLRVMATDWLMQDSKGVGTDGALMGFTSNTAQWVADAARGRVLQLDGVDDWVNLDDAMFGSFHNRTIAMWVKVAEFPDTYPYVFSFQNAASAPYRIYFRTHGTDSIRMHFVEDYSPDFKVGADTWHHVAFVLRDTDDGLCTGEYYGDGVLIGKLPGRPRHTGAAKAVSIGCFGDGTGPFAKASYDDFRVYGKALSAAEVQSLSQGTGPTSPLMVQYKFDETSGLAAKNSSTTSFARPLLSAAEIWSAEADGSKSVNLKDFSVLGAAWGQTQLWP